MRAKITKRLDPCNCGCRGQDSWHKRYFLREVRDVRDIEPVTVQTTVYPIEAGREGRARFPWGEERVVQEEFYADLERKYPRSAATKPASLGWYIAVED